MIYRLLHCSVLLFSVDAFYLNPAANIKRSDALVLFAREHAASRRDVLAETAGVALSSMILGQHPLPAFAAEKFSGSSPQTIVITGANSGIGFEACKRLSQQGHRLVLACRTMSKARSAAEKLKEFGDGLLIPAECDLGSLASIKKFAETLPTIMPTPKIDRLCLNAGLSRNSVATDVVRTADGFEVTVGTNHFGHFYLNHFLLPMVDDTGRIIVTASTVHDPTSSGGKVGAKAGLGDFKGLIEQGRGCEMIDGSSFDAVKAYKDSKLCNILFTRELQRRLDANSKTSGIVVNCFNPGLIASTGLYREQNSVLWKAFDFVATDVFKVGETPYWGGGCLNYVTTVDTRGQYYDSEPGTSKYGDAAYGKQFGIGKISEEAQDDEKARRLWELSDKLLNLA